MPHSKKKDEVEKISDADKEVLHYMKLVYKVRESKDAYEINEAFKQIVYGLDVKIKKIAGKFKIPGYSFDDKYAESLLALRFKAIKDYDETRGTEPGKPAPFDRFALLCIRRHLATTLKTSHQNKHRVQNESKSLDQDRGTSDDELSLINIVYAPNSDVVGTIQKKENFKLLMTKLFSRLSGFEKQVFKLYASQFTYEEIAETINAGGQKYKVNIKGVDNALSRIKNKAKVIAERMAAKELKESKQKTDVKSIDNALQRIKKKAKLINEPKKTTTKKYMRKYST